MLSKTLANMFVLISSVCFISLAVSYQIPLYHKTSSDYLILDHSQGYQFDPLLHLPGISPYFDAVGFGLEHIAPLGCNVTAASYLVRHAAIYANDNDYDTFIEPFLSKLNSSKRGDWTGPLYLFHNWTSPYTDIDNQMEQITPDGAHISTKVGDHLLRRYPELVPTTKKVYADKKSRTQDTAKAFVRAFPQEVEVVEISTKTEFQSTIPHKSCPKFTKKAGDKELEAFIAHYTVGTISRLQPHSPVTLSANDIVGMQQLCGYESAITGAKSPICDVFTPTEWMAYEYAWDIKYSYMVGPGNPLSPYLGFPWLNVTANLFKKFHLIDSHSLRQTNNKKKNEDKDDGQRFFISFTHREVPPLLATALGIFNSSSSVVESFPTDRINFQRAWKMAELIPFLGHIGIEKMTCDRSSGARGDEDADGLTEWVRVISNSAPRPIPRCQSGPGASCGFEEFGKFVSDGLERYGDFNGVCGVKEDTVIQWT